MIIAIVGVILLIVVAVVFIIKLSTREGANNTSEQVIEAPYYSVWSRKDLEDVLDLIEHVNAHIEDMVLAFGTLLGAVRNGRIIPWDYDSDVAVPKEQYDKLEELIPLKDKKGRKLILWNRGHFYTLYYENRDDEKNIWCRVDVFAYYPNNNKMMITDSAKRQFDKEDWFPLEWISFYNKFYKVPHNPHNVLEKIYGENCIDMCVSHTWVHWKNDVLQKPVEVPCERLTLPPRPSDYEGNVYVINLKRRPDRWSLSKRRLIEAGYYPIRWNATELNEKEYQQYSFPKQSKTEISCFLSHYRLWKYLVEKNTRSALIFEDDVKFVENNDRKLSKQDIRKQVQYTVGADLVYLGYGYPEFKCSVEKPALNFASGTFAYVITRRGLNILLKIVTKKILKTYPVDIFIMQLAKEKKIITYTVPNMNKRLNSVKTYGMVVVDDKLGSDITHTWA